MLIGGKKLSKKIKNIVKYFTIFLIYNDFN